MIPIENNDQVFLSIIIPMFNAEEYIESAILSILNQDKHCILFEIIIVDDASTDKSVELLNKLIQSSNSDKINLCKLPINMGTAHARNVGIKTAKGNWILFMDSDDKLGKNLFLTFQNSFDPHFNCYIYGVCNEFKDRIEKYEIYKLNDKRAIGICGVVWNKILHKSIIVDFKEEFKFEDTCFLIDIMNNKEINIKLLEGTYYQYNKTIPSSKMAIFNVQEFKNMYDYVFSQIKHSDELTKMYILETFVGVIFSKDLPLKSRVFIAIKTLFRLFKYVPKVIKDPIWHWIKISKASVYN